MRENRAGIELALLNGPQDTREYRVGVGAEFRSIAAADLARDDDSGTDRVLGAPVGGVDRVRFEEKREDGRA